MKLLRREETGSKIIQPVERLAFSWRRANLCNLTGERQRNYVDIGRFVGLVVEKRIHSQACFRYKQKVCSACGTFKAQWSYPTHRWSSEDKTGLETGI